MRVVICCQAKASHAELTQANGEYKRAQETIAMLRQSNDKVALQVCQGSQRPVYGVDTADYVCVAVDSWKR